LEDDEGVLESLCSYSKHVGRKILHVYAAVNGLVVYEKDFTGVILKALSVIGEGGFNIDVKSAYY